MNYRTKNSWVSIIMEQGYTLMSISVCCWCRGILFNWTCIDWTAFSRIKHYRLFSIFIRYKMMSLSDHVSRSSKVWCWCIKPTFGTHRTLCAQKIDILQNYAKPLSVIHETISTRGDPFLYKHTMTYRTQPCAIDWYKLEFDQSEAGSAIFGWPVEENDRWSQLADHGILIEMFTVLEQPHSHCFVDHLVAKASTNP